MAHAALNVLVGRSYLTPAARTPCADELHKPRAPRRETASRLNSDFRSTIAATRIADVVTDRDVPSALDLHDLGDRGLVFDSEASGSPAPSS